MLRNVVCNLLLVTCYLLLVTCYLLPTPAFAQFNIANVYDLNDPDVKNGDILIFDQDEGLQRAKSPYDTHLFGVFQEQPGVVFRRREATGSPIVRLGTAKVNVTLSNGIIERGDYITSSTLPGLGMKATEPGYIIGIALEDSIDNENFNESCMENPDSCPKDQIDVAMDLGFKNFTLTQPNSFRSILAALIILLSIIFAWLILNRVMPRAIEAIGRNPLAKRTIELSMILIVALVIAIVVGAIIAALLILQFSII